MGHKKRDKPKENDLHGFKYFKVLSGLLESLLATGCQRDRADIRSVPPRCLCNPSGTLVVLRLACGHLITLGSGLVRHAEAFDVHLPECVFLRG